MRNLFLHAAFVDLNTNSLLVERSSFHVPSLMHNGSWNYKGTLLRYCNELFNVNCEDEGTLIDAYQSGEADTVNLLYRFNYRVCARPTVFSNKTWEYISLEYLNKTTITGTGNIIANKLMRYQK